MKTLIRLSVLAALAGAAMITTASADEWKLTRINRSHGSSLFIYEREPEMTTVAIYRGGRGVGMGESSMAAEETRLVNRPTGHGEAVFLYERGGL